MLSGFFLSFEQPDHATPHDIEHLQFDCQSLR
jgi:hypothetical protein